MISDFWLQTVRPESCCLSYSCRWCWCGRPRKPTLGQPPAAPLPVQGRAPSFSHQVGFCCDAVSSSLHVWSHQKSTLPGGHPGPGDVPTGGGEQTLRTPPRSPHKKRGHNYSGRALGSVPAGHQLGLPTGCPENFREQHRPFLPTRTLPEAGVHPGEAPLHSGSSGDASQRPSQWLSSDPAYRTTPFR